MVVGRERSINLSSGDAFMFSISNTSCIVSGPSQDSATGADTGSASMQNLGILRDEKKADKKIHRA
jgi:hypothetical protein